MTNCIFCKIINGDVSAKIISETNHSISFLDAFPLTKGHTLVIPKRHCEKLQDLSPSENNDLFSLVYKISSRIDKLTGATLIAIHNGKDAGQEIPHVHVHLVPRSSNDSAGAIHSMFDSISIDDKQLVELHSKLKD